MLLQPHRFEQQPRYAEILGLTFCRAAGESLETKNTEMHVTVQGVVVHTHGRIYSTAEPGK